MNLYRQPHLIYNVEGIEFKLTYNYCNQKLLFAKGSKRFIVLLTEKKDKP
jgi:hypothetical protein